MWIFQRDLAQSMDTGRLSAALGSWSIRISVKASGRTLVSAERYHWKECLLLLTFSSLLRLYQEGYFLVCFDIRESLNLVFNLSAFVLNSLSDLLF